jgi:hypothetical protein
LNLLLCSGDAVFLVIELFRFPFDSLEFVLKDSFLFALLAAGDAALTEVFLFFKGLFSFLFEVLVTYDVLVEKTFVNEENLFVTAELVLVRLVLVFATLIE